MEASSRARSRKKALGILFGPGNEDEKLGNRLSFNADGSRLALRRPQSKNDGNLQHFCIWSTSFRCKNYSRNRGDTLNISPGEKYLSVSEEFLNQGRGRVTVYFDTQGDNSR
jgi:hypothetical protein